MRRKKVSNIDIDKIADLSRNEKSRHDITQEDFTPECVLSTLCPPDGDPVYTDFSQPVCDPCGGVGNIVIYVLRKRLDACTSDHDILYALSSIYAVELMQDNVDEMKGRIEKACASKYQELYKGNSSRLFTFIDTVNEIIDHNIVCSDFFDWNFEEWKPYPKMVDGLLDF